MNYIDRLRALKKGDIVNLTMKDESVPPNQVRVLRVTTNLINTTVHIVREDGSFVKLKTMLRFNRHTGKCTEPGENGKRTRIVL